jgi:AcrR family transcriptional regulator
LCTRKPQNIFPEKLKERLYTVVLELFSIKDFHQVNLREISTRSGLSTATIYKYFKSKENLLFSILDEKLLELESETMRQIVGLRSIKSIFFKMLLATMDYYDRNTGLAITAFITVPTRTWMQQRTFKRSNEYIFATLLASDKERSEVDPAMDERRFRDFYYMICYRVIYSWYFHGMKWKLIDAIERDFDLWWKMLANPKIMEKDSNE